MKGKKLLFNRLVLVSLAILVQIVVLLAMILWFSGAARWITMVLTGLAWSMVLYILSGASNPAYKMAWIIVILTAPVFGLALYLVFGGNRLSNRLKKKMVSMDRMLAENLQQEPEVDCALAQTDMTAAVQSRYLIRCANSPVYRNTVTEYFSDGETVFARMLAEIEQAKQTIYLEYFILAEGEMWQAIVERLEKKAAQGVDVRVIYDDFGSITRLSEKAAAQLTRRGIHTVCFNRYVPLMNSRLNNRDHRKFLLIDGVVGFTGGINIADEYINRLDRGFGHWKDCAILLRGDAVRSMTVLFLSMWNHITGQTAIDPAPARTLYPEAAGFVQPYGDSPLDFEATGRAVFMSLIARANHRIWLMTPYLIIDDAMTDALTTAAKSGLDVRIITPGIPDKKYVYEVTRHNYPALLAHGVRIFEYTPGFVHSKLFLADGEYAVVGTVNFDFRSLYLHFEDGVYLYRANCFGQIEADFESTFPQCREVSYEQMRSVSLPRRLFRALLSLFSPLM